MKMNKLSNLNLIFGYCLVIGAWLLVITTIGGCGQAQQPQPSIGPAIFYSNAKNTAPEFKPSGATGSSIKALTAWEGTTLHAVFYTLREFLPERDEGIVDRSNMYKLLYDVDALLNQVKGMAVTLEAAKVITPPFDFGNNKIYGKAANDESAERGVALNETDTTIEAIVTWIWRDTSNPKHIETGVFEASLNKNTYDLAIDFVFSVDYDKDDPTTDYNLRVNLTGNATTHAFAFNYVSGGSSEANRLVQMVGKGISKGAGNHFLFKVRNNQDSQFSSPRYIVLSAEATEDTLKNINVATDTYTNPDDLPTSVSEYINYVKTTDFFPFTALLTNRNDLNKGNPKEGTIYLNY